MSSAPRSFRVPGALLALPVLLTACSAPRPAVDTAASDTAATDTTGGDDAAELHPSHEMVEIPEGPFLRGCVSAEEDPRCRDDPEENLWLAAPQREIYLSRYWIDRTEVTYRDHIPCVLEGVCEGRDSPPFFEGLSREQRELIPVFGLDWYQADTYCRWRGARLPTEAEWEKAARGTDDRSRPWGDHDPTCGQVHVIYPPDTCDYRIRVPEPVATYPGDLSPYGVYDLGGNVAEWVSDWAGRDYYAWSPDRDPQGPDEPDSQYQGRVLRGFTYDSPAAAVRVFSRVVFPPSIRSATTGFRCASSIPPDQIDDPRFR